MSCKEQELKQDHFEMFVKLHETQTCIAGLEKTIKMLQNDAVRLNEKFIFILTKHYNYDMETDKQPVINGQKRTIKIESNRDCDDTKDTPK